MPNGEAEWQRLCEIEQAAVTDYFKARAQNGFSLAAMLYATAGVIGSQLPIVCRPDRLDHMTIVLCDMVRRGVESRTQPPS